MLPYPLIESIPNSDTQTPWPERRRKGLRARRRGAPPPTTAPSLPIAAGAHLPPPARVEPSRSPPIVASDQLRPPFDDSFHEHLLEPGRIETSSAPPQPQANCISYTRGRGKFSWPLIHFESSVEMICLNLVY